MKMLFAIKMLVLRLSTVLSLLRILDLIRVTIASCIKMYKRMVLFIMT